MVQFVQMKPQGGSVWVWPPSISSPPAWASAVRSPGGYDFFWWVGKCLSCSGFAKLRMPHIRVCVDCLHGMVPSPLSKLPLFNNSSIHLSLQSTLSTHNAMKCQLLPVLAIQVPNLIGSHWISLHVSHDCVRPDVHKTQQSLQLTNTPSRMDFSYAQPFLLMRSRKLL